jgi:hypothetical protein
MKKLTLVCSIVLVFVCGCQILSADERTTPNIKIEPSPILTGQEFKLTISSSKEIIMPYCGGIPYVIEKLESDEWVVLQRQWSYCNGFILPEISISNLKPINIFLTIEEEGIFRFKSRFKLNSNDDWESLYSDNFEVELEQ